MMGYTGRRSNEKGLIALAAGVAGVSHRVLRGRRIHIEGCPAGSLSFLHSEACLSLGLLGGAPNSVRAILAHIS